MPVTGNREALTRLALKLSRLSGTVMAKVTGEVAEETRLLVAEGFQRGVSPDGRAWAPLRSRSGQPLRDTGRLASSLTVEHAGLRFSVGTNVVYAPVHQYGATITAKRACGLYSARQGQFFGKTVTIPARPFLPTGTALPPRWEVRVREAASEALILFLQ